MSTIFGGEVLIRSEKDAIDCMKGGFKSVFLLIFDEIVVVRGRTRGEIF